MRGLQLEHIHGRSARQSGGQARQRPAAWLAGVVTIWTLLSGWLVGLGVPFRFAAGLATGLGALAVWGVVWVRLAVRGRQRRVRPRPLPWATPRQAERIAWQWMRYLGYPDARLTGSGADGGLDVVAAQGVAQVKATAHPVGRPVVQQTYGAASGRATAVFSLGGFTGQARRWASAHDVALFGLGRDGDVFAANDVAGHWIAAADRRARAQSSSRVRPADRRRPPASDPPTTSPG